MPPGSKRGRRVARKAQSIESTDKARDMLTKSIHEYFRKTVSAECCFFHRRSKLASRNGLSFLIGLLELLKKVLPHFSCGKVTVTPLQNAGAEVKRQTE